jgi:hypothetical protein
MLPVCDLAANGVEDFGRLLGLLDRFSAWAALSV